MTPFQEALAKAIALAPSPRVLAVLQKLSDDDGPTASATTAILTEGPPPKPPRP